jgi:drug/metabolite transporter (DMT)-like permease
MGVALIQFLKAFTPIVVTIFSVLLLGQRPSLAIILCLITLCACSAATAAADLNVSTHGLLLAAASASTEAVRLVLTQYVLQDCRFTLWGDESCVFS